MQGIAAAKELQLRGRALFYAEGAVERTRGINAATAGGDGRQRQPALHARDLARDRRGARRRRRRRRPAGAIAALPAVGLVLAGAFRLLPALNQILFLTNSVQFSSPAIDLVEHELETFGAYADQPPEPSESERPARTGSNASCGSRTSRSAIRPATSRRCATSRFAVRRGGVVRDRRADRLGQEHAARRHPRDPRAGPRAAISVDGVPLAERREAWQRSIGYVPQDVYLVDDTLRANVALGWYGDEIDDERVLEAIRLAELDDVVAALPDGLETMRRRARRAPLRRPAPAGRPRARALHAPSVLVLDEATSNLDQATEQRIVETLDRAARRRDDDRRHPPRRERSALRPHPLPRAGRGPGARHLRRDLAAVPEFDESPGRLGRLRLARTA